MSQISTDAAIQSVLTAQQGATQSQIAVAIAAKGQQASQAQGDAAVQLVQAAAQVGRAEGRGGEFDAVS